MEKRYLIRALSGKYGYVKAPAAQPSSIEEALAADSTGMGPISSTQSEGLSHQQDNDANNDVYDALVAAVGFGHGRYSVLSFVLFRQTPFACSIILLRVMLPRSKTMA